jgi:hypothetical protein
VTRRSGLQLVGLGEMSLCSILSSQKRTANDAPSSGVLNLSNRVNQRRKVQRESREPGARKSATRQDVGSWSNFERHEMRLGRRFILNREAVL